MHTLWLREHNRLVEELAALNPHWSDQRLFHEGRKIIGAQMQHLTFSEFLPIVLGEGSFSYFIVYPFISHWFHNRRACDASI